MHPCTQQAVYKGRWYCTNVTERNLSRRGCDGLKSKTFSIRTKKEFSKVRSLPLHSFGRSSLAVGY